MIATGELLKHVIPVESLMKMPYKFINILRDVRLEQKKEQQQQMEVEMAQQEMMRNDIAQKNMNGNKYNVPRNMSPPILPSGSSLEDILEGLS